MWGKSQRGPDPALLKKLVVERALDIDILKEVKWGASEPA